MASGRPVAATAVNGVVDIVDAVSTGLLAPPGQPEALARNVVWLLDHQDAARCMGEAGRARVRELFDATVMCRLIEGTYARMLGLPETVPAPPRVVELDADASATAPRKSAARRR